MRRLTVLFLCLFLTAAANAKTKQADPNEWDFGQAEQGQVLEHDFELKNDSSDILEINSIHTSCGCTASKAEKKSLLPGESTKIKVTFNTRGYTGKVKQYAYVNTDSADIPIVRFTIKVLVVKEGQ